MEEREKDFPVQAETVKGPCPVMPRDGSFQDMNLSIATRGGVGGTEGSHQEVAVDEM